VISSRLEVTGDQPWSSLTQQWVGALRDLVIRHPNGKSTTIITIVDGPEPTMMLWLDETRDSRDRSKRMRRFVISNVRLTYFPGVDLARKWMAAAFASYCLHEALECCTVGDFVTRPLDPHAETEPGVFGNDKGLRDGLPVVLTPETLATTLAVPLYPSAVQALIGA
jgi:hypothetical protein